MRPLKKQPVYEDYNYKNWRNKNFVVCLWLTAILPPTYNAILATINAHVLSTPRMASIIAEASILSLCLLTCLLAGGRKRDIVPILLLFFSMVQMLFTSLINETMFPDFFRNMAIIAAFTAVGYRISSEQIRSIFRVVSIIVFLFLLIEILYLPLYVSIFQPASYLQASRGMEEFSLNETGLFANALGFQDRFSFGIFNGPRTSSIFLEQVSLPGFAAVLLIFLLGNWPILNRFEKIIHVSLVLLIVLSNNSRTSSALLVLNAIGYFLYPYFNSRLTALIMPVVLGASFVIVGPVVTATGTDDLVGRLSVTVAHLTNLSASEFIMGSLKYVSRSFDSGYGYLIVSSSLAGLLIFWAYVTLFPKNFTPSQRRVHWGLAVYVYLWLLIGGTAIFTMKTAALLWLVVGNIMLDSTTVNNPRKQRVGKSPIRAETGEL